MGWLRKPRWEPRYAPRLEALKQFIEQDRFVPSAQERQLALAFSPVYMCPREELAIHPERRDRARLFKGVFTRVRRGGGALEAELCIQYWALWNVSVASRRTNLLAALLFRSSMTHRPDLEPLFVYLNRARAVDRIVYDRYHLAKETRRREELDLVEETHPRVEVIRGGHGYRPFEGDPRDPRWQEIRLRLPGSGGALGPGERPLREFREILHEVDEPEFGGDGSPVVKQLAILMSGMNPPLDLRPIIEDPWSFSTLRKTDLPWRYRWLIYPMTRRAGDPGTEVFYTLLREEL